MTTPVEVLQKMAATYEERQQQYGEAYLMTGKVLQVLFPDGIVLNSESEFNKWHLLDQIVAKLCRYAMSGKTHADSVHDIAVYAAMIESMGTCCCMDRTAFDVDYTHVCGCKSKEERIAELDCAVKTYESTVELKDKLIDRLYANIAKKADRIAELEA